MGKVYGYVRVSTREQNEGRQLIALSEMRVPRKNIYSPERIFSVPCIRGC